MNLLDSKRKICSFTYDYLGEAFFQNTATSQAHTISLTSYMHTVTEHNYAILSVAFMCLNTDFRTKIIYSPSIQLYSATKFYAELKEANVAFSMHSCKARLSHFICHTWTGVIRKLNHSNPAHMFKTDWICLKTL